MSEHFTKYLPSVDKLHVRLRKKEIYDSKPLKFDLFRELVMSKKFEYQGFKFEKVFKKDSNYDHCFKVWNDEFFIAEVYYGLYIGGSSQADKLEVRMAKNQLYATDFLKTLDYFNNVFNCKFDSPSKLEIAIDSNENFLEKLQLFSQKYRFVTRFKLLRKFKGIISADELPELFRGINIGDVNLFTILIKGNGKTIRIYDKTKEIREKEKDEYLLKYFKENGLDINKPIFRFELSMTRAAFDAKKTVPDCTTKVQSQTNEDFFDDNFTGNIAINMLHKKKYLIDLFNEYLNPAFQFVYDGGRPEMRVSDCSKIDFFEWPEITEEEVFKIPEYPNTETDGEEDKKSEDFEVLEIKDYINKLINAVSYAPPRYSGDTYNALYKVVQSEKLEEWVIRKYNRKRVIIEHMIPDFFINFENLKLKNLTPPCDTSTEACSDPCN